MDLTITLGNVLTVVIFIIGLFASYKASVAKMTKMEFQVNLLWEDYKTRFNIKDGD